MIRVLSLTIALMLLAGPCVAEETKAASETAKPRLLDRIEHRKPLPSGMPSKWDRKIPLPDGAQVTSVKPPVGAAQAVELSAPGDYDKMIAFYHDNLPKAGFQLGPELKVPSRKAYNLNFARAGVQDTLSIYPDKTDPSRVGMRIVYTPEKGWVRRHLAKWEDRARILPKWWRHHEEEKHQEGAGDTPATIRQ